MGSFLTIHLLFTCIFGCCIQIPTLVGSEIIQNKWLLLKLGYTILTLLHGCNFDQTHFYIFYFWTLQINMNFVVWYLNISTLNFKNGGHKSQNFKMNCSCNQTQNSEVILYPENEYKVIFQLHELRLYTNRSVSKISTLQNGYQQV